MSMHSRWKAWLHLGSRRVASPSASLQRQTAHSTASSKSSGRNDTDGSASMTAASRPRCCGPAAGSATKTRRARPRPETGLAPFHRLALRYRTNTKIKSMKMTSTAATMNPVVVASDSPPTTAVDCTVSDIVLRLRSTEQEEEACTNQEETNGGREAWHSVDK